MESMRLDVDGWYKPEENARPEHLRSIQFTITEECHRQLESLEEQLQTASDKESWLDVDFSSLELKVTPDCGELTSGGLRVYINPGDERAHFHLVGHGRGDKSLIYSNPVMVDMLI